MMGKVFLDDLRKLVINDGEQRHYQATLDYLISTAKEALEGAE